MTHHSLRWAQRVQTATMIIFVMLFALNEITYTVDKNTFYCILYTVWALSAF